MKTLNKTEETFYRSKRVKTVKKLPSWIETITYKTVSREQALEEFYRYRFLVLGFIIVGFILALFWGLRVAPAGIWRTLWLIFLVTSFLGLSLTAIVQAYQGYRCTHLYPSWQLKIPAVQAFVTNQVNTAREKRKPLPNSICLIIIFSLGYFFTWLINLNQVQWAIADSGSYHGLAYLILSNGYTPDPQRPSGYPVLISYFYQILGTSNSYPTIFFSNIF